MGINRSSVLRSAKGFTLYELMITIGVLAIVSTMAIPTFKNVIASQNLNKSTRDLTATFTEARAKATFERRSITVRLNTGSANTDTQINWMPSGKVVQRAGANQLVFLATGMTNAAGDSTFELCDQSLAESTKSKIITISRMGTVQMIREGSCS